MTMMSYILHGTADAAIADLKPFFDLLATLVDGQGFLDINS